MIVSACRIVRHSEKSVCSDEYACTSKWSSLGRLRQEGQVGKQYGGVVGVADRVHSQEKASHCKSTAQIKNTGEEQNIPVLTQFNPHGSLLRILLS